MHFLRKIAACFLLVAGMILPAFSFAACDLFMDSNEKTGRAVYEEYVAYAQANGVEPLEYAEWLNSIKGVDGINGANGADGSMWITGTGLPQEDIGKNGDIYFDKATCDVYVKTYGIWSFFVNIKGETGIGTEGESGKDGATWLTGSGAPSYDEGCDGDLFLDNSSCNIYSKKDGEWVLLVNIKGSVGAVGDDGQDGATWLTGNGAPSDDEGCNGDLYLDGSTCDIYHKNDGEWALLANIKGATGENGQVGESGEPGATWFAGDGEPDNGEGSDGDFYFDKSDCNLYEKRGGEWEYIANIKGEAGADGASGQNGADGATWHVGDDEPESEAGKNGDIYLNKSNCNLYIKTDGAWLLFANIKGEAGADGADGADGSDGSDGADGAVWFADKGAPSDVIGKIGDMYLDRVTCDVYQKYEKGWKLIVNIKGQDGITISGEDGENGLNGKDGLDGKDGVDGATWLTGEGAPVQESGRNGDLYLDQGSCDVYIKTDGEWAYILNISGAEGADGADGQNGRDGVDGADGADGATWLTGEGAPEWGRGKSGDLYFDTLTCDVYQKLQDGWTKIANVKGEDAAIPQTYVTVTFDYGDGESDTTTVLKGQTVGLPVGTRDGKVFLGWYYGEGANRCKVTELTPILGDVTFTAEWLDIPQFTFNTSEESFMTGKAADISGIYTGECSAELEISLTVGDEEFSLRRAEKAGLIKLDECEKYKSGGVCTLDLIITFLKEGEYTLAVTFNRNDIITTATRTVKAVGLIGETAYSGGCLASSSGSEIRDGGNVTCYSYNDCAILRFYASKSATVGVTLNGNPYDGFGYSYNADTDTLTVTLNVEGLGEVNSFIVDVDDGTNGGASVAFRLIVNDLSAYDTLEVSDAPKPVADIVSGTSAQFEYTICDPQIMENGAGKFYVLAESKLYGQTYSGYFGQITLSEVSCNTVFATVRGEISLNDGEAVTFSLIYISASGDTLTIEDCVTVRIAQTAEWQTAFASDSFEGLTEVTLTATIECRFDLVTVTLNGVELSEDSDFGDAYRTVYEDGKTTVTVIFEAFSGESYEICITGTGDTVSSCTQTYTADGDVGEDLPESF